MGAYNGMVVGYTAGDWICQGDLIVVERSKMPIARICGGLQSHAAIDAMEQAANGRLLALAPKLLRDLKFLVDAAETEPGMAIYNAHIEKARAHIDAAEWGE